MTTLQEVIDSGVKLTPMMAQYMEIKKDFPDTLVLFRMGDFYELFFEDAKSASQILNIALTHRGKLGDFPIPMSGIPHHAAPTYIDRITERGLKAAICEQVEDPKMAKGIVKRAVTQVVSPGMPFDLEKSKDIARKYMAAAIKNENQIYLILVDFTTGDFKGLILDSEEELIEKLQIYGPKEFLTYAGQWSDSELMTDFLGLEKMLVTSLDPEAFREKDNGIYIERLVPTYKRDEILKLNPAALRPIAALSFYISTTQGLEELYHIKPFMLESKKGKMVVSYPTLVGIEIFPKNRENYKNSLLGYFDKTKTAMGSRELKQLFLSPSRDALEIENRHDLIEQLLKDNDKLSETRKELEDVRDLERIMAKVSTKKANSADLLNLSKSIEVKFELEKKIKLKDNVIPKFSKKERETLLGLSKTILKTISDEIGANLEKGNLIKPGASKKRDKLARLTKNATDEVLKLEEKYRKKTGIAKLKVKHNNINGYFIEVSKLYSNDLPNTFERKQTLVNSERFLTKELREFEKEVVSAKDKLYRLEKEIFDDLISEIANMGQLILKLAKALGLLDVFACFSYMAIQDDLIKPIIIENKKHVDIKGAWHPLIKANIKDQFVCHNINLNPKQYFGLVTGPNMAGKTTVMREVAIIQFLTQVGSFVPAKSVSVGLCDYLFSRLGASDDIIQGQSTFMVEMSETAEIIRHATKNSLIILDEIGRGTSTFDGMSIAWALVEHLVEKTKALTLFSTHYHELIELADSLKNAKNFTVETVNKNGEVQFLYRLIEKGATQSFGIHVARLAGLPQNILLRSEQILKNLEKEHAKKKSDESQMDLFSADSMEDESLASVLENDLKSLDVYNMTPLEALQKLNDLRDRLTQ